MSLRASSWAEAVAQQQRALERRRKRLARRKEIGTGPDRTTIRAQLDYLYSLAIRRRDRRVFSGVCLVCKAKQALGLMTDTARPIEVCYHIVPRGDDMTRWHMDNAVGACSRCNNGERWSRTRESLRARYRQIHVYLLGESKLSELEALSRKTADFSTADLIEKRDILKRIVENPMEEK